VEEQPARDSRLRGDVLDRELVEGSGREHLHAELDQLRTPGRRIEAGALLEALLGSHRPSIGRY
jgi:hypothetical protein